MTTRDCLLALFVVAFVTFGCLIVTETHRARVAVEQMAANVNATAAKMNQAAQDAAPLAKFFK